MSSSCELRVLVEMRKVRVEVMVGWLIWHHLNVQTLESDALTVEPCGPVLDVCVVLGLWG